MKCKDYLVRDRIQKLYSEDSNIMWHIAKASLTDETTGTWKSWGEAYASPKDFS